MQDMRNEHSADRTQALAKRRNYSLSILSRWNPFLVLNVALGTFIASEDSLEFDGPDGLLPPGPE